MSRIAEYAVGFIIGMVAGVALLGALSQAFGADGFVQMLQMRFAMQPGQTRVLPECGCTIRYMGTSVNGRHYTVRIDRLD